MFRGRRRRDTRADLAQAQESLASAARARAEQERKKEQEHESVIARLDRLAAGNHLAELALRALTDRYGDNRA